MNRTVNSLALLLLLLGFIYTGEVRADTIDPVGDTFGTGTVQHDITSINATFNSSSIIFTVDFAGNILPASGGSARSIVGYIDIDTDQNASTGAEPAVNDFAPGPAILLGAEFSIDLYSEEFLHGQVDVLNDLFDVVGSAPIIFSTNSFSVMVPLSVLGGDDGLVNYGVVVGTFDEATDRAPNGAVPATSTPVPEPATTLLLGTGLAAVAHKIRTRRRTGKNEEA